jgi:hypothetical protein
MGECSLPGCTWLHQVMQGYRAASIQPPLTGWCSLLDLQQTGEVSGDQPCLLCYQGHRKGSKGPLEAATPNTGNRGQPGFLVREKALLGTWRTISASLDLASLKQVHLTLTD